MRLGPANPPHPDGTGTRGNVWATQQLDAEAEPTVTIEYVGSGTIDMRVADTLPLRMAIDELLGAFEVEATALAQT